MSEKNVFNFVNEYLNNKRKIQILQKFIFACSRSRRFLEKENIYVIEHSCSVKFKMAFQPSFFLLKRKNK